ncbi:nuclear transport factor 2 family protein [Sphingomonas sp. CJ20]
MILPAPLQSYFNANAKQDLEAMVAPFAAAALVRDESQTHEGRDAIRAWIRQSTIAVSAIATPQAIRSHGATHEVTAEVSGAFPGSPVTLTFRFVLDGESITDLEIK